MADDDYPNWLRRNPNVLRRLRRVKLDAGPHFDKLVADVTRAPVTTAFGPIQQPLHARWSYPLLIPEIIEKARAGAFRYQIVEDLYLKYEMPERTAERLITVSTRYNPLITVSTKPDP